MPYFAAMAQDYGNNGKSTSATPFPLQPPSSAPAGYSSQQVRGSRYAKGGKGNDRSGYNNNNNRRSQSGGGKGYRGNAVRQYMVNCSDNHEDWHLCQDGHDDGQDADLDALSAQVADPDGATDYCGQQDVGDDIYHQ